MKYVRLIVALYDGVVLGLRNGHANWVLEEYAREKVISI